ncbi:MAG: DMT family transporter [Alcanivoracaceae bacterium]|jgi:drug/metabolite transporter (DMT)-like permease|nr:DMT family transporter [Alcanivoracaceae bacterium]
MQTNQRSPNALAYLLLLTVGCLIAAMLPLSKMAMAAGATPLAYAFWQSLGGAMLLSLASVWRTSPVKPRPLHLRYALLSGLTAIAIPNGLAFVLVAKVGAGLTATLYALPSLLTYGLALSLRMEQVSLARSLGLSLAVLGCACILWPRDASFVDGHSAWMTIGLGVPLSLAIGNIYRSRAWPRGAKSYQLAPAMLFAGALFLGLLTGLRGELNTLWLPGAASKLVAVQACLTALGYVGFFELQRRTSPVFLSQIGFVITLAGLVWGVFLFGEEIDAGVWAGIAIILPGMVLANRADSVVSHRGFQVIDKQSRPKGQIVSTGVKRIQ